MTLQSADLDRLEQLSREATPGPWRIAGIRPADSDYLWALSPAVVSELVAAARLGGAWQEAEAALPEGWAVQMLWGTITEDRWAAAAGPFPAVAGDPNVFAGGPTPAAALLALAEALRELP